MHYEVCMDKITRLGFALREFRRERGDEREEGNVQNLDAF